MSGWKQVWFTGAHAKAAYPLAIPMIAGTALCAYICTHNLAADRSIIFWKSKAPVYTDKPLIELSGVEASKGFLKPEGYLQAKLADSLAKEKQWAAATGIAFGENRFGGIKRHADSEVEL